MAVAPTRRGSGSSLPQGAPAIGEALSHDLRPSGYGIGRDRSRECPPDVRQGGLLRVTMSEEPQ
jgi:hypothetical protein